MTRSPARRTAHRAEDGTPSALDATQAALAAEHAAVYGYGVVGGRIGDDRGQEVSEAFTAHRARRDTLHRTVRDLGGTPVASAAAYALPFEVTDEAGAVRLAGELETRLAAAYADLVEAGPAEERGDAASALSEAAVRAARWSGAPVPFPGLPEYAADGSR
ncbi:ferritin-like domain-containing protein [Streptomyces avicenniae]|uniref:ferritin-like domain-containing protein n=1 Tax=Streptomyces avicenniae TaxID=500153 RepID=UPI00069C7DE3|nr:ferritin-like domain-containing protein [Streptomyces avicenniae]